MLNTTARSSRNLRRFFGNRDGAVAPILGLMLIVLICSIGLGIDIGRAVLVKARLTDSLDAAGLAVGARLSTTDYTVDAKRFVDANFKSGYAEAKVTSVTASLNAGRSVITLTASAEMPTAFMKLLGNPSVTVNAEAEVTRQSTGLEVTLVLDNTGSMEQSGSMPTLRSAAKDLVNIVFGNSVAPPNLYVSLVPFSHTVNVGPTRTAWTSGTRPATWAGCVRERAGYDKSDATPTEVKFPVYSIPQPSDYREYLSWLSAGGANAYCPTAVTPLTNTKATLITAIDAMQGRGATHINVGAVWGWRTLSPKWRGVWGGDAKLPLDYKTKNMTKAVILMTDGDNTMYTDQYTAYGMLSEGLLDTKKDVAVAVNALNTRLKDVCTSMKSNSIIVYSVVFGPDPSQATKDLMQACASSVSNYFPASDKAALSSAFRAIGDALSNLRISR